MGYRLVTSSNLLRRIETWGFVSTKIGTWMEMDGNGSVPTLGKYNLMYEWDINEDTEDHRKKKRV